jgi:hypothetical protein
VCRLTPTCSEALAFAETLSDSEDTPAFLDCWRPWLVVTAVFILLVYGPMLIHLVHTTPLHVPGRWVM